MVQPFVAFKNFGLLTISLWPLLLTWFILMMIGGLILQLPMASASFGETLYLTFSTSLSIGNPDVSLFAGSWRILEVVLRFMGVIIWGVFVSITMKAIEGAYE